MLPSEKIYEEHSKINVKLDNNRIYEDLTRGFSKFPGIDKIFHRLIMNLKYLNTKYKYDTSLIYNCKFLHYWMYDLVINELNVTDDNKYIEIITMLYVAWFKFKEMLDESKYICEPDSGPLISLPVKEFIFRKEMYDYYYNYLKIEKQELSHINGCSETCKYLTSIYGKYETFKSTCSTSKNNKCITEFNNIVKYDPSFLFDKLKCKSECNRNEELVPPKNLEQNPVVDVRIQDETVKDVTQDSKENSDRMIILNVVLPVSVFFLLFPMLYKVNKFVI
ncbi:hypothetical protein PCYB_002550 [Plasmodium cynomolgi strain B]|uniref:CYIR protein n=1 Tax=Plasmodium cynomolgi (strain B) TaxID=1120755 RepID=K6UF54_PLACD|nr:hypothetical protein PCYB_002550 [Plasmodium cynomolgi strain B]GAB69506.1 hypothetical protein PCYB_002550 [Plasmodium cynomolgi strain B]